MANWSEQTGAAALKVQLLSLLVREPFGREGAIAAARIANRYRTDHLASALVDHVGAVVQTGPFTGMKLIPVQLGSLVMPKILGTYESEIAHLFRDLSRYSRLIDVGSAEGYYAVGCPFAHPHLSSIAYDANVDAHAVCVKAATLNGVAERMDQRHFCSPADLADLAGPDTLIVIDIDGAEVDLLCSRPATDFALSDIIVEVHQHGSSTTEVSIVPHFAETHDIDVYRQQTKDPHAFAFLKQLSAFEKYLTVWEGRQTEAWLHLKAKRRTASRPGA